MIGNLYFEQVWFPGVHADIVGGGYLENEARLSNIALGWMVAAASIIPDGLKHDGSVLKLWPYPRTFVAAPKDPVRNIVVSPKSAFSLASTDARCEGGALSFSLRRCKSRQKLIEGIFNSERHRGRSSDHNLKRATLANEAFSALSNNKGLDNVHASRSQRVLSFSGL